MDHDTGLYYFNHRWYDPGIGRFISEDPIKDGLSWYAYANNNPLRFFDSTGLYGEDVHYNLTKAVAILVGFSPEEAETIALADQGVDTDSKTNPFASVDARNEYHFPGKDSLDNTKRNSPEAREKVDAAINDLGSTLEDFGAGLHVLQDSFSHEGFAALFGHALAGHSPDKTYADMDKTLEMVQTIIDAMADYLTTRGKDANEDAYNDFEQIIKEMIDEFSRLYNTHDDRNETETPSNPGGTNDNGGASKDLQWGDPGYDEHGPQYQY